MFLLKRIVTLVMPLSFWHLHQVPQPIVVSEGVLPVSAQVDSSRLRLENNSSLKRMSSIICDLTTAFRSSCLEEEGILNLNGYRIVVRDAASVTVGTSATVSYWPEDTLIYVDLNRANSRASDRALAGTLIHEIMHCILSDIDRRGRSGDRNALSIIAGFNGRIRDPLKNILNPFFDMMNRNNEGQHELMYQLFFDEMVLVLERFGRIHKPGFLEEGTAVSLMWSGLQGTSGFQKLSTEEQTEVQLAILQEKGLPPRLVDL